MFDRGRVALVVAAIATAGALALAGCATEGDLVETRLPVQGASWDVLFRSRTTTITSGETLYTVQGDVRFKIMAHAQNACEAQRALVELRSEGAPTDPLLILSPLARYTADDRCTKDAAGPSDTALAITVVGFTVNNAGKKNFRIECAGAPVIVADVDSVMHATVPNTTRFEVRVEDATSGAIVPGVAVSLEQMAAGVGTPLGSGTTDANGMWFFDAACSDSVTKPSLPYRVTATLSPKQTVLNMQAYPARCGMRERVVVRL